MGTHISIPPHPRQRVERLEIELEDRAIRHLVARSRQPLGPDRTAEGADLGDVAGMREDGVALLGDPQSRHLRRHPREIFDLDAAQIVVFALVVAVGEDAISAGVHLAGHMPDVRAEILPLSGNAPTRLVHVAPLETGDE
jgi:hypothetical protein